MPVFVNFPCFPDPRAFRHRGGLFLAGLQDPALVDVPDVQAGVDLPREVRPVRSWVRRRRGRSPARSPWDLPWEVLLEVLQDLLEDLLEGLLQDLPREVLQEVPWGGAAPPL